MPTGYRLPHEMPAFAGMTACEAPSASPSPLGSEARGRAGGMSADTRLPPFSRSPRTAGGSSARPPRPPLHARRDGARRARHRVIAQDASANIGSHLFRLVSFRSCRNPPPAPVHRAPGGPRKSRSNRNNMVSFSYMNQMGYNSTFGRERTGKGEQMRRSANPCVNLAGLPLRYSRQLLSVRSTSRTIAAKSAAPGAIEACAMCRSR